jgi:hypothetical protein
MGYDSGSIPLTTTRNSILFIIKSLPVYESIVSVLPDPVEPLLASARLITEDDIPCASPGLASDPPKMWYVVGDED